MRHFITTSLIILSLLSVAPAARASNDATIQFSGVELYKMCASKYDTDYGYCAGYVSAVANLLLTESVSGYRACNLSMIRSQQYVDLFKKYAESFPSSLNDEANTAIAASLSRAFPCSN